VARVDHAEKFLHATGAKIAHGGTRAYYRLSTDAVQMPPFESFRDADKYYSTLCHELTRWTSAKNHLDRDFGGHRFGSNAYAQEELVAELGAAFLCADLELALEPREDHASYIANWLEVLQNDSRAIFTAAAHAQNTADFIHKFSASTAEKIEEPCAAEQSFALPGRFCQ
jgi:antirestriction protein ArdC